MGFSLYVTADRFNGSPVYAQVTQHELQRLDASITDQSLKSHLSANAPNLNNPSLRAGERLLVREVNAWVVQSVTAYRGYKTSAGSTGFHVLRLPDDKKFEATCFKGMSLDLKTPTTSTCNAKLKWMTKKWGNDAFHSDAEFVFSFGSKRCVGLTVRRGTDYKPHQTELQQFHTDGPIVRESMWDAQSNLVCNAAMLQNLSILTIQELKRCCQSRKLKTKGDREALIQRLSEWIQKQPEIPVPVHDTMFQSLSTLFAFFSDTALGVPRQGTRESLKLDIEMGTAVLFRFDFIHQGWKCVDDDPSLLPVHLRAHFYLFNGVLSELPVYDLEATLEYLSIVSHETIDDASGLQMLECLQTFVPSQHATHVGDLGIQNLDHVAASRQYALFESQQALSTHISEWNVAMQPCSSTKKRKLPEMSPPTSSKRMKEAPVQSCNKGDTCCKVAPTARISTGGLTKPF